ncbi:hypothetical protein Pelo_18055 [Pelomyxa schiedti]|nr:hypothetical protein Pelo_18055 [Pelomyxa schiedti]
MLTTERSAAFTECVEKTNETILGHKTTSEGNIYEVKFRGYSGGTEWIHGSKLVTHPAMVDYYARLRTDANLQRGDVIDGYYFGSSDA